jgi:hypothetical protein
MGGLHGVGMETTFKVGGEEKKRKDIATVPRLFLECKCYGKKAIVGNEEKRQKQECKGEEEPDRR